jgi:uncharacterized sulfatase
MAELGRREWLAGMGAAAWRVRAAARAEPPNILLICTDDQAAWALQDSGHPQAMTPNLERLCRQGARFSNAFTPTPVCSPARFSLYTGRYGREADINDAISSTAGTPDYERGLDSKFVAWPEVLQAAGYDTALIGKWHLGVQPLHHPTKHGFSYFAGFFTTVGGTGPTDPKMEIDGVVQELKGYNGDILTDFAEKFLRRPRSSPFLLSVDYREPHNSNAPGVKRDHRTWLPVRPEDWTPFANAKIRIPNPDYPKLDVPEITRMMREYLASVASVDRNVGRLFRILEELQVERRTAVIFTADHGMNMGHHGIWSKGNGHWMLTDNHGERPNLYDTAARVPAIVRWPGQIPAGAVIPQTISHLDWFPTILDVCGLPAPQSGPGRGRNLMPLLGGRRSGWNNDLYLDYGEYHLTGIGNEEDARAELRGWRTPEWKLVRDFLRTDKDELYDLRADPAESRNLIESKESRVMAERRHLEAQLRRQMALMHDPYLNSPKARSVPG